MWWCPKTRNPSGFSWLARPSQRSNRSCGQPHSHLLARARPASTSHHTRHGSRNALVQLARQGVDRERSRACLPPAAPDWPSSNLIPRDIPHNPARGCSLDGDIISSARVGARESPEQGLACGRAFLRASTPHACPAPTWMRVGVELAFGKNPHPVAGEVVLLDLAMGDCAWPETPTTAAEVGGGEMAKPISPFLGRYESTTRGRGRGRGRGRKYGR